MRGRRNRTLWVVSHEKDSAPASGTQQAEKFVPEVATFSVRGTDQSRDTMRSVQAAHVVEYCADEGLFSVVDETRFGRPVIAKCRSLSEAEQAARLPTRRSFG